MIHRDIKPANIFLHQSPSGIIAKLGDFGLAKSQEQTMSASLAGSPKYMSPEMHQGGAYNATTDVWSLGVVMLELAGGTIKNPIQVQRDRDALIAAQRTYSVEWKAAATLMLRDTPQERPSAQHFLGISPFAAEARERCAWWFEQQQSSVHVEKQKLESAAWWSLSKVAIVFQSVVGVS
jgi:serine/threonine protein kinase